MTTTLKGHESDWILEKVGDGDQRRYIVRISPETKKGWGGQDHRGWVMSADSIGLSDQFANKMKRDDTSRFVKVSSATAYKKPPTWILEFAN